MDLISELHEMHATVAEAIRQANEKIKRAGGELSAGDVAYIDQLTHAMKSIRATLAMEEGTAEPVKHKARTYSRYANGMEGMVEELKSLTEEATDDRTRRELKSFVEKLQQMI